MRGKLARFQANLESKNVLEPGKELFESIKGRWNTDFFENDLPLVVELGCGRGEYSVGLAEHISNQNFIGVDVKGARIWKGSQQAQQKGLQNVGFLRAQIQLIENFFNPGEVSAFWITFPDPRPKDRDVKRRLTSPRYLDMYKTLLKEEGWVYFKTDSTPLFEYTLEVLKDKYSIKDLEYTFDLYKSDLWQEHFGIKTKYELLFTEKGEDIKYLKFRFDLSN